VQRHFAELDTDPLIAAQVWRDQCRLPRRSGAGPSGAWLTQLARHLTMGLDDADRRFRFLVRDRNAKFAAAFDSAFDAVFTAIGVDVIRTPALAPRANAIAERIVGSSRHELLDRILIINQRHATAVLR
jgi:putative transposase